MQYNKCYKNLNKTNISIKQTETNTEKHDQYNKNQLNTENKQRNTEFYYFFLVLVLDEILESR